MKKVVIVTGMHSNPLMIKCTSDLVRTLTNNGIKVVVAQEAVNTIVDFKSAEFETFRHLIKKYKEELLDLLQMAEDYGLGTDTTVQGLYDIFNCEVVTKDNGELESLKMNSSSTPQKVIEVLKKAKSERYKGFYKKLNEGGDGAKRVLNKFLMTDLYALFIEGGIFNSFEEMSNIYELINKKGLELTCLESSATDKRQNPEISPDKTSITEEDYTKSNEEISENLANLISKEGEEVIVVNNLGIVHAQHLLNHLLQNFSKESLEKNLRVCAFEITNKSCMNSSSKIALDTLSKMLQDLKNTDAQGKIVRVVNPQCESFVQREITDRGGFEKVEEELYEELIPMVKIKFPDSFELSEDMMKKITEKGGSLKDNLLEIRADKIDKDFKNLFKISKKSMRIKEKHQLTQLEEFGLSYLNDGNNDGKILVFCHKSDVENLEKINKLEIPFEAEVPYPNVRATDFNGGIDASSERCQ